MKYRVGTYGEIPIYIDNNIKQIVIPKSLVDYIKWLRYIERRHRQFIKEVGDILNTED